MATYQITAPDGNLYEIDGPDGASRDDVIAAVKRKMPQGATAPDVGPWKGRDEDQAGIPTMLPRQRATPKANATESFAQNVIAPVGSMFVGPLLGVAAKGLGAAPAVVNALSSAGFSTGQKVAPGVINRLSDMALRSGAGAAVGGASAALVNPQDAGTGALIGGALPVGTTAAAEIGRGVGKAVRAMLPEVSPEVAALADRAKELGIPIPVDRITNSKPLNAVAASLNYVPFSGRASSEEAMRAGLGKAVSRTFGQDSENVTQALRKASSALGQKFDDVLSNTGVKMTPEFNTALANVETTAENELEPGLASIIKKQVDAIREKGAAGFMDGQAAYNIKKTLDRIGNRNSSEAFYARDLKRALMDGLNATLGPEGAQSFSALRGQYRNMLALEDLAQNGAEGGISAARLANMKNIGTKDLQELADISAQFMRTRENPHGALQRLMIGGTAAGVANGMGALGALPVAIGVGRSTNALLDSQAMRNIVTGRPTNLLESLSQSKFGPLVFQAAPSLSAGR